MFHFISGPIQVAQRTVVYFYFTRTSWKKWRLLSSLWNFFLYVRVAEICFSHPLQGGGDCCCQAAEQIPLSAPSQPSRPSLQYALFQGPVFCYELCGRLPRARFKWGRTCTEAWSCQCIIIIMEILWLATTSECTRKYVQTYLETKCILTEVAVFSSIWPTLC